MLKTLPCVLTIAGSDSSGGAGIQADVKAISANNCYAASVITAITAQNTIGVQAVYPLSAEMVASQLESVLSDLNVCAVKMGMLFNPSIMQVVSAALDQFKPPHVVLDPVMIAKNGCPLLQMDAINFLKKYLFSHCELITPNIHEAEKLLTMSITHKEEMAQAAKKMGDDFQTNVLIKGGHLHEDQSSDVLYLYQQQTCHWYDALRIQTQHTHGTGCTLSATIAANLARDFALPDAISAAKNYLTNAISMGSQLKIGHGIGPVNHFYFQETHHVTR